MHYGPDCLSSDDEDGLSDDNDYYEFKQKLKASRKQAVQEIDTETGRKEKQLKSIFTAVSYGKEEVVLEELSKGLPIDVDLELGWTPLLVASTAANFSLMSALIERGANVDQTRDGTSPLMLVCNINSKDEETEKEILQCVKLLVDKKANVNACDNKRRTAIMFAATNGHTETVKFLLPLVDKEAEDNQRWNVLFWAVDGDCPEIVKLLLDEGFDCEKTDIRGDTAADLAHTSGSQKVLDLFPKDTFDEFFLRLNTNQANFEETFNNLKGNEKPQFFNDICKILSGTRSEHVMPILWDTKMDISDFLSLTDSKLKEIGVQFPYQRSRIIEGLYKFHKHPFKPQSIPFIKRNQLYTNIDISTTILTCIKQIIAMEASLKFILANNQNKLSLPESKEIRIFIAKTRQQIKRLKAVTEQLVGKSQKWDHVLRPADRITKKRTNIPWCNLCLSVSVVGVISLVLLYKLK